MARRRRSAGEGSIHRRKDGRRVGVADLGRQDGKRERKYVYARTRAQVAKKLARCSATSGRPLRPRNFLLRDFYTMLERADLPRMRFHDLRHSAATLPLELGIHPKAVSEMLGHSQIGITLDLYSHVTATMQQQAVTALDDLFQDL